MARYGVAVVSIVVALLSSRWLNTYWVAAPVSLFLCAVMFSFWFGGPKPGLLATALSVLLFKYYYLASVYSLAVGIKEMPRLLIFALSALLCWVAERRTQQFKSLADISKWEMLCNAC